MLTSEKHHAQSALLYAPPQDLHHHNQLSTQYSNGRIYANDTKSLMNLRIHTKDVEHDRTKTDCKEDNMNTTYDGINLTLSSKSPTYNLKQQRHIGSANVEAPKFLLILYEILASEHDSVIRWSDDGLALQILNTTVVTEQVLPKYFNHTNFHSFQRQLNYFGFRKWTKSKTDICTFSHPYFRQREPHLLSLIRRKKAPKRQSNSVNSDQDINANSIQDTHATQCGTKHTMSLSDSDHKRKYLRVNTDEDQGDYTTNNRASVAETNLSGYSSASPATTPSASSSPISNSASPHNSVKGKDSTIPPLRLPAFHQSSNRLIQNSGPQLQENKTVHNYTHVQQQHVSGQCYQLRNSAHDIPVGGVYQSTFTASDEMVPVQGKLLKKSPSTSSLPTIGATDGLSSLSAVSQVELERPKTTTHRKRMASINSQNMSGRMPSTPLPTINLIRQRIIDRQQQRANQVSEASQTEEVTSPPSSNSEQFNHRNLTINTKLSPKPTINNGSLDRVSPPSISNSFSDPVEILLRIKKSCEMASEQIPNSTSTASGLATNMAMPLSNQLEGNKSNPMVSGDFNDLHTFVMHHTLYTHRLESQLKLALDEKESLKATLEIKRKEMDSLIADNQRIQNENIVLLNDKNKLYDINRDLLKKLLQ